MPSLKQEVQKRLHTEISDFIIVIVFQIAYCTYYFLKERSMYTVHNLQFQHRIPRWQTIVAKMCRTQIESNVMY